MLQDSLFPACLRLWWCQIDIVYPVCLVLSSDLDGGNVSPSILVIICFCLPCVLRQSLAYVQHGSGVPFRSDAGVIVGCLT